MYHGPLEQPADPAGPEPLTPCHPVHSKRVPGEHGEPQIGPVRLGHGPHERPVPGGSGEGVQRGVDDGVTVVVLDEEGGRVAGEHRPQLPGPVGPHDRPGRVLRPVGDDQRLGPGPQDALHLGGQRTVLVQRDGCGTQTERGHEVEQGAPSGVLHGDQVAGLEMGREHPLDRVERAGRHGHRPCGDPVRVQLRPGEAGEFGKHGLLPVPAGPACVLLRGGGQRLAEGRQQLGVRIALAEVADPRGRLDAQRATRRARRTGTHPAPPAARRLDDTALPEGPVGGGHRVRVDPQQHRQLPHGRQRVTGRQRTRADPALDTRGDLRCAPPTDPILS